MEEQTLILVSILEDSLKSDTEVQNGVIEVSKPLICSIETSKVKSRC